MAKLPLRNELPTELTWNLESIYADNKLWEEDYQRVKQRMPELTACRGTLGASAGSLLRCLRLRDEASLMLERVAAYAHMRRDEDNANSTYQALYARVVSLGTEFSGALSFMAPEILAIADDRLQKFLAEEPDLATYAHHLEALRQQREHVRTAEVEEVLAQTGEMANAPRDIFGMLTNADIKFPTIKDEKGNDVQLTNGRYVQMLESRDRRVRADAFNAMHSTYGGYRNTLASSLAASVRRDTFYSRTRHYPTSLDAALQPENIPTAVYHNLVQTVNQSLPRLHRYMALRKRALGLDELHMYDLHVPLARQVDKEIPYEEGVRTVVEGLSPLGADYIAVLQQGIRDRWIDVLENENKTSGAYSSGAYDSYPFVLMNYQNNLSSVATLAHELGHSMHSHYARHAQPYVYGHYTIFVAEVASTLNEALLTEHLIRTSDDASLRMHLLNQYIDKFRTTLYRQTMFAEFELLIHQKVEEGGALTAEDLCALYAGLNAKYHGPEVVNDEGIATEWARIPHFYSSYYVYQYATGISAAISLAQQILKEGQPAVARYLDFLRSGESAYSIDLLRKAGVDMASPAPVQRALDVFESLLGQFETMVGGQSPESARSSGT